ncbi:hypothetical protein PAPYR_6610 [Paratrimastix pyriformis]|uniref:KIF-binding protein n=1 Tax=Paratrimastix pyriformis TaxID=342808 RepID=A0ABQ8UET0_9EUKA|nr:hypothetical protein PAPYR_6610 [Paratrimastix pyriformis]
MLDLARTWAHLETYDLEVDRDPLMLTEAGLACSIGRIQERLAELKTKLHPLNELLVGGDYLCCRLYTMLQEMRGAGQGPRATHPNPEIARVLHPSAELALVRRLITVGRRFFPANHPQRANELLHVAKVLARLGGLGGAGPAETAESEAERRQALHLALDALERGQTEGTNGYGADHPLVVEMRALRGEIEGRLGGQD